MIGLLHIVVIDEITKFEICPKIVLWTSKHGVPLGCTSLVVSEHFSEFLYGIYWWALVYVYVFAGDTVRDLKISLKKCKNHEKIRTLLVPSIFEAKQMCLMCITQHFGSTEKSLVRKSVLTKNIFSPRSAYEILWPSQLGGNYCRVPPSGVQNSNLDGFYLVIVIVP